MKKVLRSLLVVTALTAATSTLALADTTAPAAAPQAATDSDAAQPAHFGGKHHRSHRFFARLARKLQLTDQQKAQAKELFRSNRDQAQPLLASLRTERHQLRTLVQSGTADEAALRAQSAKLAAIQADLVVQRAQAAKQFQALLTPDQLTKLKQIQAKREQRFQERVNGLD